MKTCNRRNKKYLAKTCKKYTKNTKGGDETNVNVYIFKTHQISTEPNTDNTFKEIGIIHLSESIAINAARGFITGVANVFGKKGFENTIYDDLRNDALKLLQQKITSTQKVSNLRIEIDRYLDLVYVHIYGTLLEKIKHKIDIKNI
jgi:hypothetical protein